jgi:hypothetical protein
VINLAVPRVCVVPGSSPAHAPLDELRCSRPVFILDAVGRNDEGDLVFAGALATPKVPFYVVRHRSDPQTGETDGCAARRLTAPVDGGRTHQFCRASGTDSGHLRPWLPSRPLFEQPDSEHPQSSWRHVRRSQATPSCVAYEPFLHGGTWADELPCVPNVGDVNADPAT